MTESGKTTMGVRLAHHYYGRGWGVLVLDPLCDPRWNPEPPQLDRLTRKVQQTAFKQMADGDEFLKIFWASKRCMVFIDESGDAVGRYDLAMQQTATKGRHWGHSVHFLSQRGVQINRTVRDQCSHLFLFTTAREDAKVHANEWNQPALIEAAMLPQGSYFHVTRFGKVERGTLFEPRHAQSAPKIGVQR
jgi:hypothetical protein